MKLYSYFRSSASYRVRIALALKGLPYEYAAVHLLRGGGQQHSEVYRDVNPEGLVPTLEDGAHTLTQSLAILEYLEELHPSPALLPSEAIDRAYVRSVAFQLACDVHPINNLRVLQYLSQTIGITDDQKTAWYRHWIDIGITSLEKKLEADRRVGLFVYGDSPTIADICLVPQVWNARRFQISLERYPTITRIAGNAMELDAFVQADPSKQPDAES
ncbi:maleylacetoacetate isomerase [Caballeronia calidae]|uniref:Maleylacetoacetate isomerase n=1 Tax=Caballeronia calidae TaxID=1777139 RepID=A0A158DZS8_9BURK|nr:maleylacetoacetate isomerase [Caballeronia calidae]SAL00145.1 maleylacetoacetate isomerase [Caballeronia calidae]